MNERSDWPIVVGGCPRSGTSLVRRILNAHPGIHCGPEATFFRDFFGAFRDDPLAHLRFTRTIRSLVSEDTALEVLGRAFVELHERAARDAGKARWADKAPENVLYTDEWGQLLGERWLLVHVVRNPLDTIASMQGRFPLTLPEDIAGKADLYRAYVEAGLAFADAHPARYARVMYEDLCFDPNETVERLMAWLGEEYDHTQLAFNEAPQGHGLEDPEVARTDGVHRRGVSRWKSILSGDETAVVWSRTGEVWGVIDPHGRYVQALERGNPGV